MSRAFAYSSGPLFMQPPIDGLGFGVLRRHYHHHRNDTVAWVHGKLHPIAPEAGTAAGNRGAVQRAGAGVGNGSGTGVGTGTGAGRWAPTAIRWDVLLPADCPDVYADPALLCREFEAAAVERQKDLVLHLKLTADDAGPLHRFWERARGFAAEELVKAQSLPVILALHDPTQTGYHAANAPHIHVMGLARTLSARGFGRTTSLACDGAHAGFAAAW